MAATTTKIPGMNSDDKTIEGKWVGDGLGSASAFLGGQCFIVVFVIFCEKYEAFLGV